MLLFCVEGLCLHSVRYRLRSGSRNVPFLEILVKMCALDTDYFWRVSLYPPPVQRTYQYPDAKGLICNILSSTCGNLCPHEFGRARRRDNVHERTQVMGRDSPLRPSRVPRLRIRAIRAPLRDQNSVSALAKCCIVTRTDFAMISVLFTVAEANSLELQ